MSFFVEIWGDGACFTRPEMKVERVSYDVITPSAARNILQSIYWHPGMNWVIDAIQVCNPIRFARLKRNEVKHCIRPDDIISFASTNVFHPIAVNGDNERIQRTMLHLVNVRYIIKAHFELTGGSEHTAADFAKIIGRRMEVGGCYHQPYMGTREFTAYYRQVQSFVPCIDDFKGQKDFGYMLFDMDYSNKKNIKPVFFRAVMNDGIINVSHSGNNVRMVM